MANVKISALPSYTGSAADLRWFVMNDSGETTTYKYSGYTSPFKVENYAQASIFSIFGTPAVYDADCVGSVVIGSEAAAYDDYTTLIGWKAIGNNDIEGRCTAVGADAQATARFSTAYGMSSRATGFNSTAVGHNATASATDSVALGHTATASASNAITIGKGLSNQSIDSVLIGGLSNVIGSSYDKSVIIGGRNHSANNQYATIVGGAQNTAGYLAVAIGGFNANVSNQSSVINGESNTASAVYGGIFGGTSNTASGNYSSVIGSSNSSTNNLAKVVMLGTTSRTASVADTTYVENLKVFGSFKGQVGFGNYNNGNQGTSYQIDWSNGNIQKIVLTGNTTFSATNITDGTTYIFKVQQDGTGNRTGTWTSSQFKFPNSTPPTLSTGANAVDIFTFVAMDGVLYGVAQLNFG